MAYSGKGLETKVLIAVALLTITTIFQLVALASDNWIDTVRNEYGVVGSSGLWRVCTSFGDAFGLPNDQCRDFVWTDNQVSHWFRTVQTFEVLAFVFGCTALFMMLLFHYIEACTENKRLKVCSIALLVFSFLFALNAVIIIGALKDVQKSTEIESTARLSWGWGFGLVSSLMYLFSTVAVAAS